MIAGEIYSRHMVGCQGALAKLLMDTMWYLDAMGTLRSPSNPHPSQTLISRRPPLLSICVCDSETACNQLLGGVYVCLCVHVCVYVTCCFLLKAMINVPLCSLTMEQMYLWGDRTTNTHIHIHTVWLSQPAKLLAWLLGYDILSPLC